MPRKVEVCAEDGKGHRLAVDLADQALGHGPTKEVGSEFLGRHFEQVGQLLELGQFLDEPNDDGQVLGLRGADLRFVTRKHILNFGQAESPQSHGQGCCHRCRQALEVAGMCACYVAVNPQL